MFTSFPERLHAMQRGCRLGLALVTLGLTGMLLLPGVPMLVTATLGLGFTLATGCSCALRSLRCPSCGHPFCGPEHGSGTTSRASIFTRACRLCGDAPE